MVSIPYNGCAVKRKKRKKNETRENYPPCRSSVCSYHLAGLRHPAGSPAWERHNCPAGPAASRERPWTGPNRPIARPTHPAPAGHAGLDAGRRPRCRLVEVVRRTPGKPRPKAVRQRYRPLQPMLSRSFSPAFLTCNPDPLAMSPVYLRGRRRNRILSRGASLSRSEPVDDKPPVRRAGRPVWETVAIFLAIASLWPAYILPACRHRVAGEFWKWICYAMLAVMVLVAVRRFRAFGR